MAYITLSNSLRILRKIDGEKFKDLKDPVYKKPIFFLSKYEESLLRGLQELMKDPERFIKDYYVPIEKKDTYTYVFEGRKPAYHYEIDCPNLLSDYRNFEIPKEIKERGEESIKEFRRWFKSNIDDLEKPEIFSMRLFHKFHIKINLRAIDYKNSGVDEIDNLDLEELEKRIDEILRGASNYFNENKDKCKAIMRFEKLTFLAYKKEEIYDNETGLTDTQLKTFLKFYDKEFKRPVKKLLIEYYRIKLNPELKFEGNLLEMLGFVPCSTCQGELGNKFYKDLYKPTATRLTPDERKDILNNIDW